MDFDALEQSESARRRRRIAFVDFWPGFDDDTDRFVGRRWFAENLVDVEVVHPLDDPAVVVFSVFGYAHQRPARKRRAKLVFYTGENIRPPVGEVPLCLSFDHLPHLPPTVHSRLPIWALDSHVRAVLRIHEARLRGEVDPSVRHRRGFCSWVASNAADRDAEVRVRFVKLLSQRCGEVACGGQVLNNVGGPVADKVAFLRGYRFNVAFENASRPGYCTEKVLHAFAAQCVPIYWGDPALSHCIPAAGAPAPAPDFNPGAAISAHDFGSFEELVAYVAKVDRDPTLLEGYLRTPCFSEHWYERLQDWGQFCRELTDLILHGAKEHDEQDLDDCLPCEDF